MSTPETPHVPVIPPPRFFFAGALAAALFFAFWAWLSLAEPAGPGAQDTIPKFDWRCAEYWHLETRDHQGLWELMVYFTDLGDVAAMTLLTVMGSIWQTAIRHRFLAIAWLIVICGGGLVNQTAKVFFDRDRPPVEWRDRAVRANNKSFPSGHSMGSVTGYGMLAYALILPQRRRPRRIVTVVFLTSLVLAIGMSRIYLRAHWFSDVVGGWTFGLSWLFLCVGYLEHHRRQMINHKGHKVHKEEF
jgi:membrane-associated phospholipid phosphatase